MTTLQHNWPWLIQSIEQFILTKDRQVLFATLAIFIELQMLITQIDQQNRQKSHMSTMLH